jgi:hypothetical protein
MALIMLAGVTLVSCGATRPRPTNAGASLRLMPVAAGEKLSRRAPASLARAALPRVGAKQRVDAGGSRLAVTLRRVVDPLRGSGAELRPQTRAVGVIIQILSSGPRVYDSSATGDISVVASSGLGTPCGSHRTRAVPEG